MTTQTNPTDDKTPVTLVTGFLGSGKTTLVNYILKEQREWKICVVENEFGEVQIDGDLVKENLAAAEDIITMDNGCVCCSIRGDLVRTFGSLVARRKEFDAIIIETTGVADPSPIIFTFNSNALLQDNFRLDSVVCLVDAKHVGQHLDEHRPDGSVNEAENQIAFADRILLNKVDLVTPDDLEDLEDRIRSMNSFAHLVRTERSRVNLGEILGLNSFSLEKLVEMDPTLMDEEVEAAAAEAAHDHAHSHAHGGDGCTHGGCTHDHSHSESCGHGSAEGCTHDHAHTHTADCKTDCTHDHAHAHSNKECTHDHEHSDACSHGHDDGHSHGHGHGHNHKSEEPKRKRKRQHNLSLVTSVGYTIVGLLDVPLFNEFMSSLLKARAADIFRSKGVLAFADQGDTKFVFQGVHDQIQFGPSDSPWGADEERVSKMVFIGKNLDAQELHDKLKECTVDPSTANVVIHKRA